MNILRMATRTGLAATPVAGGRNGGRGWFGHCLRRCGIALAALLTFALLPVAAQAAAPDPIEFGVTVERGDVRTVKRWLDEGLSPDFIADRLGTGLMIAAWNGDIPMMSLFVERGATVRQTNRAGEQALLLAAWNGHLPAVQWLLDHGATLNRPDLQWSALHYAVFNGQEKVAQFLIERGAKIDARSPNASTPLMLAAREGRESLAKTLLEAGADTKAKNDWGDSALTLAMRYDHLRLGRMISTPEEFAIAARAPKESFGPVSRSVSAPGEIDELLRQLRQAQAEGRPTDELRQKFFAAVNTFRQNTTPTPQAARRPFPLPQTPGTLVITGRRGQVGSERAELQSSAPVAKPASAGAAEAGNGGRAPAASTPGQVADLLRELRLAEVQGRPTQDIQRRLNEALDRLPR
ncbi:ankyrin repeat domain-containing protein [Rhodocyclus gracilis]|nr:ankyrin repeat domain-containing protein [Rhodocyclus gracilis]